jgi:phosphoribosyl 1,2-cyclic phosphodiesterase
VLGSGSSGNCIYVDTGDCKVLLDVGLPYNETKDKLREFGVKLSSIDYILVTHNHGDHIQSLEKIMQTYDPMVISSFSSLFGLDIPMCNVVELEDGQSKEFENLIVTAHEVSHDADETFAFTIQNDIGERLLYMTDLGITPEGDFSNYTCYITEANYSYDILKYNYLYGDLHMVQCNRVHGDTGHLSIEHCIEFLERNVGDNTKQIILSHLSSGNGNKELFLEKANEAIPFMDIAVAEHGLSIDIGERLPF